MKQSVNYNYSWCFNVQYIKTRKLQITTRTFLIYKLPLLVPRAQQTALLHWCTRGRVCCARSGVCFTPAHWCTPPQWYTIDVSQCNDAHWRIVARWQCCTPAQCCLLVRIVPQWCCCLAYWCKLHAGDGAATWRHRRKYRFYFFQQSKQLSPVVDG